MKRDYSKMTASEMINTTIMALNDGSEEAWEVAYNVKQQAIATGDKELIAKIQYLWEVI